LNAPVTVHDVARALPGIDTLRDRCRTLALLDAILDSSDFHGFSAQWGPGEQLASMDNGSGDAYSIVFGPVGVFIRGFAHESRMSPAVNDEELWPGVTRRRLCRPTGLVR
jgi:hypothetical protein